MKRRYKIVLGVAGGLVLLVVTAVLLLDHIGKAAIESAGESAMGVTTRLQSLSLRPLAGKASLDGLVISNPQGFGTPHFMALGHGALEVEVGSVLEDTVVAPSLLIEKLDVNLEKGEQGANYEVILANLKKGEEPNPEEAGGKKFVVREVVMRDIRVQTDVTVAGKKLAQVELHFDEIRLENVGSDTEGGALLSSLMGRIVAATLQAVFEQAGDILPDVIRNGLGAGLEGLGKLGKGSVKVVGKVTRSVGGKMIEGVGKVVEGIGGIFGRDKKK